MKHFWKFQNSVDGSGTELILEGAIASESWWDDEVTPGEFREELNKHSGDLTVIINSPGGDVFAGVAIYNYLREYEGNVTIRVDGFAASIASIVAMAGDKIVMNPGSMMMIHKPWTLAMGDAEELKKTIEVLDGIESSLIPIYATRSGKTEEEIAKLLEAETWMDGETAVAEGFADEFVEAKSKAASFSDAFKALLHGEPAFSMQATKESIDNLAEKVKAHEESAEPEEVEEVTVTVDDVTTTTENPQEVETTEEPTDPPVETEVEEDKEKEEMATTEEIATAQVIEPSNQAPVTPAAKMTVKEYLDTKESMEAFARILESNAVAGSAKELAGKDASEGVRAAWKEHLETKMGVTNPEIFLPTPLIQEIEDAFKTGGEIWSRVSKTSMDSFNAAWDAATDPSEEVSRAKGYNREDQEEKAEQEITIANRILRPQFVYKYITLNKEDVKEQRTTGALVRFVLSELPRRIIREIERAIVIGDGRTAGSDYKIQEGTPRGFYPILADAVSGGTGNVFASLYTPEVGEDHYASVVRAYDELDAEGTPVLISKKGYVTDMKLSTNANGGYIFPLGSNFANILEVDTIVQPDWFNDTTSPDVDAILVVLPAYRVVGDQSVEAFQNFILKTNKNEYLQEIWAGGGLTFRKAAVAIAAVSGS